MVSFLHDEWESRLAEKLGRLGETQRRELMTLLGDPPDLNKITAEYWTQYSAELQNTIEPLLAAIYLQSAAGFLSDSPALGADWTALTGTAAQWARRYTYDLVSGLTDTTRAALQKLIPQFFEREMTVGELRERLGQWFGPVRAEMIATTEVTRASTEGRHGVYSESGIAQSVLKAPAHIRCRCDDRLEFIGDELVIVWQTSEDELVCVQPLSTPWGLVRGCRGLNDTVISQGAYLGMKIDAVRAAFEATQ